MHPTASSRVAPHLRRPATGLCSGSSANHRHTVAPPPRCRSEVVLEHLSVSARQPTPSRQRSHQAHHPQPQPHHHRDHDQSPPHQCCGCHYGSMPRHELMERRPSTPPSSPPHRLAVGSVTPAAGRHQVTREVTSVVEAYVAGAAPPMAGEWPPRPCPSPAPRSPHEWARHHGCGYPSSPHAAESVTSSGSASKSPSLGRQWERKQQKLERLKQKLHDQLEQSFDEYAMSRLSVGRDGDGADLGASDDTAMEQDFLAHIQCHPTASGGLSHVRRERVLGGAWGAGVDVTKRLVSQRGAATREYRDDHCHHHPPQERVATGGGGDRISASASNRIAPRSATARQSSGGGACSGGSGGLRTQRYTSQLGNDNPAFLRCVYIKPGDLRHGATVGSPAGRRGTAVAAQQKGPTHSPGSSSSGGGRARLRAAMESAASVAEVVERLTSTNHAPACRGSRPHEQPIGESNDTSLHGSDDRFHPLERTCYVHPSDSGKSSPRSPRRTPLSSLTSEEPPAWETALPQLAPSLLSSGGGVAAATAALQEPTRAFVPSGSSHGAVAKPTKRFHATTRTVTFSSEVLASEARKERLVRAGLR